MITFNNFETGKSFPPKAGSQVRNGIAANRALYNGKLYPLGVDITSPAGNLFSPVANTYTDFLLSEGVTLGNGLEEHEDMLLDVLYFANVDSLALGTGVVASLQTGIVVVPPDSWFRVIKNNVLVGEVIAITETLTGEDYDYAEVTKFDYLENKRTTTTFQLKGGKLDAEVGTPIVSTIVGRCVATLPNGYITNGFGKSAFEDIKKLAAEIIDIISLSGKAVKKNSRPHLVFPDGSLQPDEDGNFKIAEEGMVIPITAGDIEPYYLVWEAKYEAAKWVVDNYKKEYNSLTGLSPALFEPDLLTGQLSGEALRRLLIVFLTRLSRIKHRNKKFVKEILGMVDNNMHTVGGKRLPLDQLDINFDYEKVFTDGNPILEQGQ